MSILDATVSLFYCAMNAPHSHAILRAVLHDIASGVYRQEIAAVRAIDRAREKAAYKAAKEALLAFTPGCDMKNRYTGMRWTEKLLSCTQLVHFDFDHITDVETLKAQFVDDPYCCFAFVSPGGEGVKVGFAAAGIVDRDTYKRAWAAFSAYLKTTYPAAVFTTDKHVSFLHALCFVSDDPHLYRCDTPEVFPVTYPAAEDILQENVTEKVSHESTPFTLPADRRTQYAQQAIANATKSIESSVKNKDRHHARLAASRLLGGYIGAGLMSYDDAYAALVPVVERNTDNLERSMRTIADGLHHGMASPVSLAQLESEREAWVDRQRNGSKAHFGPLISTETEVPSGQNVHLADDPLPPEEASEAPPALCQNDTKQKPISLGWQDTANAEVFVEDHGHTLRFCHPWNSWLVWNGRHWERDTSGHVMRRAKLTIKRLASRAANLEDAKAQALLTHVKKSLSTDKLKAMIENAKCEVPVQPDAFDTHVWLLNVDNGTVDLKTGILHTPHRQADMLTKCLAIPYTPSATCPTWEQFLWRIMGGTATPDEPEMSMAELEARHVADERARTLIQFLQRAIGYALTGSTREQCLFILHGITKTGKSTFLATLRALYGAYGQQADMSSFMHKDRQEVRNDLADLAGSRFVCALESQEGQRLAESLIKQLTGGTDLVKARFLFQEYFTFTPQFKIFLGTNHKPVIKDTDGAIWERIRLVPFTVQIPQEERDKSLDEKLQQELPGILAWAIRGCLEWQRLDDLCAPDAVIHATATYREESDTIGRFIAECCLVSSQVQVKASEVYEAYKRWCDASGEHAVTLTKFGNRLEEQGFSKEKKGTVWRKGLTVL